MSFHLHTLVLDIPRTTKVVCEGCDVDLRLATGDEAKFIADTGQFPEGSMFGPLGTIVVPFKFSLFQEA